MLDAGNVCEFGYGRESEEKKNLSLSCSFFSIVVVAAANISLAPNNCSDSLSLLLFDIPRNVFFNSRPIVDCTRTPTVDDTGKNREGSKSRRINCNKLTSNPAALHQERSGQGSLGWS
ncbi:uncharacterized protein BO88DRAFT_159328 [Aspergillus vadensis CBS 113365]|uniref:Uncharacterized protein n=1 Tax=Aspergillus vadensis (strain CBS 113365 / IMI 142717 / IBT 24658) TaxID=1448311 RepID=A0A319AWE4_ASPVC|nr:hypothetical protein BO88DRAFT_159328 [Aspergillus vadensis CBS 113365]PYH64677.1 hypothetical protein BO88DRAFT_159328 [Aspergillus vadensis CBS 113365]